MFIQFLLFLISLAITAGVPLGLLLLAIKISNYQNKTSENTKSKTSKNTI